MAERACALEALCREKRPTLAPAVALDTQEQIQQLQDTIDALRSQLASQFTPTLPTTAMAAGATVITAASGHASGACEPRRRAASEGERDVLEQKTKERGRPRSREREAARLAAEQGK